MQQIPIEVVIVTLVLGGVILVLLFALINAADNRNEKRETERKAIKTGLRTAFSGFNTSDTGTCPKCKWPKYRCMCKKMKSKE